MKIKREDLMQEVRPKSKTEAFVMENRELFYDLLKEGYRLREIVRMVNAMKKRKDLKDVPLLSVASLRKALKVVKMKEEVREEEKVSHPSEVKSKKDLMDV